MVKVLLFILILFNCLAANPLTNQLKINDELHKLFKEKRFLSKGQTSSYEGVKAAIDAKVNVVKSVEKVVLDQQNLAFMILDIYNAINDAYHRGHSVFEDSNLLSYNLACKRLVNAITIHNADKNKKPDVFLDKLDKKVNYILNLPESTKYSTAKIRLELINWILGNFTQKTQIERSLEYNYPNNTNPDASKLSKNGIYDWENNEFKKWLHERFKRETGMNDSPPVSSPTATDEEDVSFFQDMLINERLHPEYDVFYHSVQAATAGLLLFNSHIARLVNASGAVDHARVQPYEDDITKWLKARYVSHKTDAGKYTDATGAVKNVNAIVQFMNNSTNQDSDQIEPVAKHLSSTSYSLFTPQFFSAIGFFKYCLGQNKLDAVFKNTWDQLTTTKLDADKYSKMIEAKFTEKDIVGHNGYKQPAYKIFPTIVQFFIKKEEVDNVVYFGSFVGGRLKNKEGNSKIAEVINAFMGTNLLQYYKDCLDINDGYNGSQVHDWRRKDHFKGNTLAEIEGKMGNKDKTLQGKIAVSSQAFFNGVANGAIRIKFNVLRNQEYVALRDIRRTIGRFVDEDIRKALKNPKNILNGDDTAIKKLSKVMSSRTISDAEIDGVKQDIEVEGILDDNFQFIEYDYPKYEPESTEKILNRSKSDDEFLYNLAISLQNAPLSDSAKETLFIKEALSGLLLRSNITASQITRDQIVEIVSKVFDVDKNEFLKKKLPDLKKMKLLNLINKDNQQAELYAEDAIASVLSNNNPNIPVTDRQATESEKIEILRLLYPIALKAAKTQSTEPLKLFDEKFVDKPLIKEHKKNCRNYIYGFLNSFVWDMKEFKEEPTREYQHFLKTNTPTTVEYKAAEDDLKKPVGNFSKTPLWKYIGDDSEDLTSFINYLRTPEKEEDKL